MTASVNRQVILKKRPQGLPDDSCYEWRESPIPEPGPDQLLVRNVYMSLDPAIRGWMDDRPSYFPPIELGEPMRATTIGIVVKSNAPGFEPGDIVQGLNGWEDYSVAPGEGFTAKLPVELGFPLTHFLSVLGPTALTSYFGLHDLGKPKAGETVLVSGGAGAVGSIVGQLAKLESCHVTGIAGTDEKCSWMQDTLGFDAAFNYRTRQHDLSAAIAETCPNGVDIYFDNVGGPLLEAAIDHINDNARILLCGAISGYNSEEPPPGPRNLWQLIVKTARMEGFLIRDYLDQWAAGAEALGPLVAEGNLKHREHIEVGLENATQAFLRLFDGSHEGKLIVDIASGELP